MDYLKKLLGERTTLDGMTLVGICGAFILFGGIAKLVAWCGLAYGLWTLFKTES